MSVPFLITGALIAISLLGCKGVGKKKWKKFCEASPSWFWHFEAGYPEAAGSYCLIDKGFSLPYI
jgi:hypothetical protein